MKKKEFSCMIYKPVIVKTGKRTVVYVDYILRMKDEIAEGRTWGVAKKSETDEYNKEFGIVLAKIRAKRKADQAIEKKLVEYSKKFWESYARPYKPRHMTATETMIKERNKPHMHHYDLGEKITKIEHLGEYLVVFTKTRMNVFTMENDVLIKKGEIKI